MQSMPSLDDMMNPKAQLLRARYENARYGVAEGWKAATRNLHLASKCVTKPDGTKEYIEPSTMEKDAELVRYAKFVAKAIESDLNETLKILDEGVKDGTESKPTPIPRSN